MGATLSVSTHEIATDKDDPQGDRHIPNIHSFPHTFTNSPNTTRSTKFYSYSGRTQPGLHFYDTPESLLRAALRYRTTWDMMTTLIVRSSLPPPRGTFWHPIFIASAGYMAYGIPWLFFFSLHFRRSDNCTAWQRQDSRHDDTRSTTSTRCQLRSRLVMTSLHSASSFTFHFLFCLA